MHEEDDRLKKEIGAGRRSRASEDRNVTEDRVRTDDDRLMMFRQQMFNDALPDLPPRRWRLFLISALRGR